jgi:uncharacterized protein YyaL (SSP411 family)
VTYLLREMRDAEGGFFSSQDADSEGVEGRFFTWSWDELASSVGEPVARCFGATPEGNWTGEDGSRTNVLWRPVAISAVATEAGVDERDLETDLAAARSTLFKAREERVRPTTDDKVLAGWNAMAARALAEAGRTFGQPAWVEAAERCAGFVLSHLRDGRGRLLRSWRAGVPGGQGFADDHALMSLACLTLYETTFDPRWFEAARELADVMIDLFYDEANGGFFVTRSDAEALVIRPKELYDNAVPSGNSAAAESLLRLSHLSGDPGYERAGSSALRLVRDVMGRAPTGFGHALCALDLYLGPTHEVAIIGRPEDERTQALVAEVQTERFLPDAVLAVGRPDRDPQDPGVPPLLHDRVEVDGLPTAYVCERFTCRLPVTSPEDLAAQLLEPPRGA